MKLLELLDEPSRHHYNLSEAHRLIVPEDPLDVEFEVLHPDSCPVEPVTYIDHEPVVDRYAYRCILGDHVLMVGVDHVLHAFDDDYFAQFRPKEKLLPGTYTMWCQLDVWPERDSLFGGWQSESRLIIEPQAAIGTGYYLPEKCAQRTPWSLGMWQRAYERYGYLGAGWEKLVDMCETTGHSPMQAGDLIEQMLNAYSCNGICITAHEVGIPQPGIAIAHPDCDCHGGR